MKMMFLAVALLPLLSLDVARGFTVPTSRVLLPAATRSGAWAEKSPSALFVDNFLGDIPNPFAKAVESLQPLTGQGQATSPDPSQPDPVDPNSPEGLIAKAKAVLASDLGVRDASILGEEFIWIGPMQEQPLGKTDYLAAGKFFNLRATFPDLDYRAHDFRIDDRDPQTVRVTVRTVGTMRGVLRLRNEQIQPNGMQMRCPPEAISMTFDERTGKLVKLCSGFAMDRLVGNTNGLCGVKAAATIAGVPPSEWELYPIPTVLSRFFGRPAPQLDEVSSFLAPFPETVMVQLTKGIIAASLGADDPTLLSDKSFIFYTPTKGPIRKKEFLESYAREEFGNPDPECSHFRVDPYDPYRVWVDIKPVGPGFEGPPQAVSFAFDDDGFCTRISAGAVMDPSIGNTGGLTGADGIRYASGEGAPEIATRPLPLALGRFRKSILSPITKVGVDEYSLPTKATPGVPAVTSAAVKPKLPPTPPSTSALSDTLPKLEVPTIPLARQQQQQPSAPQQSQVEAEQKRKQAQAQAQRERQQSEETRQQEEARRAELAKKKVEERRQEQRRAETEKRKRQAAAIKEAAKAKQLGQVERKPNPTLSLLENFVPSSANKEAGKVSASEQQKKKEEAAKLAEKKRQEAIRAAEQKKQEAIQAAEQRKQEAARLAEQKRQEAAQAVEQRKQEAARRAEEAKQRAEAEKQKREAAAKAAQPRAERKPNPTLSLFENLVPSNDAPKKQEPNQSLAAKANAQKETMAKQKAAQEARKRAAEAKKQAAMERAEKQKAEAERKKQEAEDRKKKLEEQKAEAARKKQEAIAARKAAQEARQKEVEAKKAEAERKRKEAAAAKKTPAASAPSFGFGLPKSTTAPAGVPTIASWTERRDGGITGRIFGSVNFREGERVETSVITQGEITNNSVVTTESGSRYFLSDKTFQELKNENKAIAQKELSTAAPRATIRLTQFARERDAKAAEKAIESAKPRATFSLSNLFGLGGDNDEDSSQTPTPKAKPRQVAPKSSAQAVTKKAPRGVPSISRWRQNRDRSITGLITGSPSFPEGERITTSPIARGEILPGELVTTASGSRYFLL